jgi:hypothetical protein
MSDTGNNLYLYAMHGSRARVFIVTRAGPAEVIRGRPDCVDGATQTGNARGARTCPEPYG